MSRGHLSRDDRLIFYSLGSATGDLHKAIRSVMARDDPSPEQMFAFVRDLSPVDNPFFELLRSERFGEVSLMDICFQKSIPEADQLQRFDTARKHLQGDWTDALAHAARQAQTQLDSVEQSGRRSEENFVIENTQDAVDDPGDRARLVERLDDPVFCTANFVRIEPGATAATFRAVFRPEGAEAVSIEFSNRHSSNREIRGEILKTMLRSGDYSSLRGLLGQGYLGAGDPIVGGAVNGVLQQTLVNRLGFDNADDLKPFLLHLRDHGPADLARLTFDAMRATAIGRTNLLEVFMGADAPVPPVPEAPAMIPVHLFA